MKTEIQFEHTCKDWELRKCPGRVAELFANEGSEEIEIGAVMVSRHTPLREAAGNMAILAASHEMLTALIAFRRYANLLKSTIEKYPDQNDRWIATAELDERYDVLINVVDDAFKKLDETYMKLIMTDFK